MLNAFLLPLLAVGLAELGDKTQIALFVLASQTKRSYSLLLGSFFGFIITSGVAVLLGDFVNQNISQHYLKHISGGIFIAFGLWGLWKQKEVKGKTHKLRNPFFTSFGMVLLTEMGDKSQIVTTLFATKYNAFLVFLGVLLALSLLSALAIFLGNKLLKQLPQKTIAWGGALVFIIIGVAFQLGE